MTKTQLIAKVSRQTGLRASEVETVLDTILENIAERLANDENVTIAGFGRFEMRERKDKPFTNPKTKEHQVIPARKIPGWKASGLMKQKVGK